MSQTTRVGQTTADASDEVTYPNQYDGKDLEDATLQLIADLIERRMEFDTDPRGAIIGEVLSFRKFAWQVCHFAEAGMTLPSGITQPIDQLILALKGLEYGLVDLIVKPSTTGVRAPLSLIDRLARTNAAAAMAILIELGMGWEQAGQMVVRAIRKHRILERTSGTWRVVKTWLEEIEDKKPSNDKDAKPEQVARWVFDLRVREARKIRHEQGDQAAQRFAMNLLSASDGYLMAGASADAEPPPATQQSSDILV
jgi:hypothetical protein